MTGTPMKDMLDAHMDRLRMHMPGAKGKALPYALPPAWDVTELSDTDDLYAPKDAIARAQALAAQAAGAAHTLLLTGGSTAGILAMLLYAVSPGGKVILPRNVHHAVLSACVLGDLRPVYVPAQVTPDGLAYYPAEAFLSAMAAHPDAQALLVTVPDYYGVATPLCDIAREASRLGIRLLVDQAHGAHWNWWDAPRCAGREGARLWVQSAHKTLPVPTAGAWLHAAEGEDIVRLRAMLRLVQTSSPSYMVMAALDQARAYMDEFGRAQWAALRARLPQRWPAGIINAHDAWAQLPLGFDDTRLVLDVTGRGLSGYEAAEHLAAHGVDVEMADAWRIVCIVTPADDSADIARLERSLDALPQGITAPQAFLPLPEPGMSICAPRQAVLGAVQWVPMAEAVGRVAAASIGAYPPGVPVLAPGEAVTAQACRWLAATETQGGRLFGVEQGKIACVDKP